MLDEYIALLCSAPIAIIPTDHLWTNFPYKTGFSKDWEVAEVCDQWHRTPVSDEIHFCKEIQHLTLSGSQYNIALYADLFYEPILLPLRNVNEVAPQISSFR